MSLQNMAEKITIGLLFYPFLQLEQINYIFSNNVHILTILNQYKGLAHLYKVIYASYILLYFCQFLHSFS